MATKKRIPRYGTVTIGGHTYYRTTVTDNEGKQISLYGKTRQELYDKELDAIEKIEKTVQKKIAYCKRVLRKVAFDAIRSCSHYHLD